MDWSDWAVWVAVVAVAVVMVLYVRLMRKNRRLHRMAEEARRLRLQSEQSEQRNRQLKQEMTSNIAHELKTPVSSIRGYLEILLGEKPLDEARRRHFLERCYRQTLRLSDLIQDVSLINKIEESAELFPREEVDVNRVVAEVFSDLADAAAGAGVTLTSRLPGAMPVSGNRELLYGIFRNLTENAVAYAGEGVEAAVELYRDTAECYYIHFYDTGRGVADASLPQLFDRFVRLDEGRSRSSGGTGLGLSIVKHAVLFHGGEIYAKNRPGGGLEFFFSLRRGG